MKKFAVAAALVLSSALTLTACGGSSSGGGGATPTPASSTETASAAATAPADPTAAKAEIKDVWTKFFNSSTPLDQAATLLEGGDSMSAALKVAQREDQQTHLDRRAKVKLINFVSPTRATVTWTLLNGKTPVLDNASGEAVLVDGQWKVSKVTFCTLVELGNNNKPVPGCSA